MDIATTATLVLTIVSGIPTVVLGLTRLRLPRPPLRSTALCLLLVVLRLAPAAASLPPPGERIETPAGPDFEPPQPAGGEPAVEPSSAEGYVVAPGDSLWAIACRHLSNDGEPPDGEVDRYWRAIYAANRATIGANPDLIFPGQALILPPVG